MYNGGNEGLELFLHSASAETRNELAATTVANVIGELFTLDIPATTPVKVPAYTTVYVKDCNVGRLFCESLDDIICKKYNYDGVCSFNPCQTAGLRCASRMDVSKAWRARCSR